jgi:tellurite resistance protein
MAKRNLPPRAKPTLPEIPAAPVDEHPRATQSVGASGRQRRAKRDRGSPHPHSETPTPDETLDAVLTAAALIARADGWIQPAERRQLLDFVDRRKLLPAMSAGEMIEVFARRVRKVREPGGPGAALRRLARHAGRVPARLVLDAAEEVAAADGRLDPREDHLLRMLRIALTASPSSEPPAPPPEETT